MPLKYVLWKRRLLRRVFVQRIIIFLFINLILLNKAARIFLSIVINLNGIIQFNLLRYFSVVDFLTLSIFRQKESVRNKISRDFTKMYVSQRRALCTLIRLKRGLFIFKRTLFITEPRFYQSTQLNFCVCTRKFYPPLDPWPRLVDRTHVSAGRDLLKFLASRPLNRPVCTVTTLR